MEIRAPPPRPAPTPDPTPVWEPAPSPHMPSAIDIEHARRVGNAGLFDRPPPADPQKVLQALLDAQVLLDTQQLPPWTGSKYRLPVPEDRLAAILAVPDHQAILTALAGDPMSPVRSQAAALAAFLQIEAAMPALRAILDLPIPPKPSHGVDNPSAPAQRAEITRYTNAVANWRLAIAGLAGFDQGPLFPRLTAILFDPPAWFVAPHQPDPSRDADELRRARQAVYRMLVRSGGKSEWDALKKFEERARSPRVSSPAEQTGDAAEVSDAISSYFATIEAEHPAHAAPDRIDQVAVRGERARARAQIQNAGAVEAWRVSLRRQDAIWRVEDYWPAANR